MNLADPHATSEQAPGPAAFVLGNGPSLRDVDLTRLTGVTTIGMNSAYRYWERIDWHPTHYCCLDDELVATHHKAIWSLVTEGLVRSAFLTAGILDFHPELAGDQRCLFLDSIHEYWHGQRGQQFGLPFIEHPAFQTSAPTKVTTGAYAVRYAIFLGHTKLYLLGIDCNYVEVIEGARSAGGTALEMVETPGANPNYFFDDYQQAGDRYNVPNPDVHGGNLHLQSVAAVRDDVITAGIPVEIRTCSAASRLTAEGVLPYEDLDRALSGRLLGAVAVPMTPADEGDLVANLRLWSRPAHLPRHPADGGYPVPLVLLLNGERDPDFEARIRRVFNTCESLHDAFAGLEFRYCRLTAEEDVYERERGGSRSGPNTQFFRGMELLRDYGRYVFTMETDCLPVRPGWLTELERVVDGGEPFWVLGSVYRGVGPLADAWRIHINGNAVYAAGDDAFQAFLADVWRPGLETMGAEVPSLAYDCALPLYFNEGGAAPDGERWHLYQRIAHQIRYTEFIQNHAGKAETERGEGPPLAEIRARSPRTYIVHGRHLFPERAC